MSNLLNSCLADEKYKPFKTNFDVIRIFRNNQQMFSMPRSWHKYKNLVLESAGGGIGGSSKLIRADNW